MPVSQAPMEPGPAAIAARAGGALRRRLLCGASLLAGPVAVAGWAGLTGCAAVAPAPATLAPDSASKPQPPLPSLAQALAPHFHFGVATTPAQMAGDTANFIGSQFNMVVAENVMKPSELAPEAPGQYRFEAADALVDAALARGLKVRGHTLVWHNQAPAWMFVDAGRPVSRAVLVQRLQRYIADVVGHFKGRVMAWDVVNEAFSFGESDVKTDANGMRLSPWREIIGEDYIEIAFAAAAKADPNALLFYNDYETQDPRRVLAISQLVSRLKARGVKIDGIGHQAHYTVAHPDMAVFDQAIQAYGRLGVTQHVTELDVALNGDLMKNGVTRATPELLALQAQRYADFFKLFIKHRRLISSVLMWGIDDAHTWLTSWPMQRFEAPLLFDRQRQPKPAFWAVHRAAQAQ
jgi:endo-1,4-beta-xylanase